MKTGFLMARLVCLLIVQVFPIEAHITYMYLLFEVGSVVLNRTLSILVIIKTFECKDI